VGACIVNPDRIILGIGYNGFPRGCSDDALPWAKLATDGDPLKTKYPYVCHAEMNAILNKNNSNLHGASIYVSMYPCNECAKLIIQASPRALTYTPGRLQGGSTGLAGMCPHARTGCPTRGAPISCTPPGSAPLTHLTSVPFAPCGKAAWI